MTIQQPEPLPTDTALEIISNHHRRRVIALLLNHNRTLTLNDLTKEIVVREIESPITEIAGNEMTRIAISLHHTHLPKLDDTNVIEYDIDRKVVEPTERLDQLEPYLPSEEDAVLVQPHQQD